jgi:hypothetical protein
MAATESSNPPAMSPDSPEARKWSALLAERLPVNASAAQVSEAMAALWGEIDAALHPVLGHRGVAALYQRSLTLCAASHPWLRIAEPGVPSTVDAAALRAALGKQGAAEALAGATALLHAFHALLASLVGASLTDRLLRAVWAQSPRAPAAQDTAS